MVENRAPTCLERVQNEGIKATARLGSFTYILIENPRNYKVT